MSAHGIGTKKIEHTHTVPHSRVVHRVDTSCVSLLSDPHRSVALSVLETQTKALQDRSVLQSKQIHPAASRRNGEAGRAWYATQRETTTTRINKNGDDRGEHNLKRLVYNT